MTEPLGPVVQECVEGYLYATPPLELLLFRRPPSRGRIWVPVSGKVDPEDRTFEAALTRELVEETGLTNPASLEALDWHVRFRAENGDTWQLHAYAVRVPRSFEPVLSPEHDAFEWVSLDEALGRLHFEDNQAAVRRLAERLGRVPSSKV
ncbi:MAG TPA: NUDIX domain-containing protein [Thermoplasmata archaeon]|nr:NUDIX domain-containing protein [Thermoplasmata archaeon]